MIGVGVGNVFRRDDGAGPAVIEALRGHPSPGVTLAVTDGEPARLIELWTGADLAVVVDAVRADPPEPGRIHEFHDSAGDHAGEGVSGHSLGLGSAVELARTLDRMPAHLHVYAIEGTDFSLGAGLTPTVGRAVAELATRLAANVP